MKSSPRQSVRSSWVLSGIGLALVLTQSGCPGGADLENPQAWSNRIGTENGATAGSGGMSPSGPVLDFSTVACASSLQEQPIAPASRPWISSTSRAQRLFATVRHRPPASTSTPTAASQRGHGA